MDTLEILQQARDESQKEMAEAELAYIEAKSRAEQTQAEFARLEAAVAALSGEPPPAAIEVETPENTPSADENTSIHDMTPEEFDAERKRRQRRKQKEEQANNPYAHIKCSGCGQLGTMYEAIMQAPSGAPIRMMTCGSCGNQLIQ